MHNAFKDRVIAADYARLFRERSRELGSADRDSTSNKGVAERKKETRCAWVRPHEWKRYFFTRPNGTLPHEPASVPFAAKVIRLTSVGGLFASTRGDTVFSGRPRLISEWGASELFWEMVYFERLREDYQEFENSLWKVKYSKKEIRLSVFCIIVDKMFECGLQCASKINLL